MGGGGGGGSPTELLCELKFYVYFYSADNIRTPVQYTYVYRIRVLHYKRSTVLRAVARGGGGVGV